jgi:hypothetical protein
MMLEVLTCSNVMIIACSRLREGVLIGDDLRLPGAFQSGLNDCQDVDHR